MIEWLFEPAVVSRYLVLVWSLLFGMLGVGLIILDDRLKKTWHILGLQNELNAKQALANLHMAEIAIELTKAQTKSRAGKQRAKK